MKDGKLLVLAALSIDPGTIADLEATGRIEIRPLGAESGAEFLNVADGIYGNQDLFRSDFLDRCPALRWVQIPSAGYDQIDLGDLRRRSIALTNGKGVYSVPIAEDVVAKMLIIARNYRTQLANQQANKWERIRSISELNGKTACILGTGSIASAICGRLKAFDMKVIGINTDGRAVSGFDKVGTLGNLAEMLPESDWVICTLPLTHETRGLLDSRAFNLMKAGACLINISRGSVVVEDDLIDALAGGHLGGAGLDVFEHEPLPEMSPLWSMPNVVITAHTSGFGDGTPRRLKELVKANLNAFIGIGQMRNIVLK